MKNELNWFPIGRAMSLFSIDKNDEEKLIEILKKVEVDVKFIPDFLV